MRSAYLAILLLALSGCAVDKATVLTPDMTLKELNNTQTQISKSEVAMQIVEVSPEHFHIENQDIPDKEIIKKVKIVGANLQDLISLFTEATNENIVFQLQSEAIQTPNTLGSGGSNVSGSSSGGNTGNIGNSDNDYLLTDTSITLSASNMPFGKILKKTIGGKIGVQYEDGTFHLAHVRTATLKIPSIEGLGGILQNNLATMGSTNISFDAITSTISFSAREKEYDDIMRYLEMLRNNLYVIEYEIAIYDVELKDNYALGIDWTVIPSLTGNDWGFIGSAAGAMGTAGTTGAALSFGALFQNDTYSGKAMVNALENFGKVESVQRPKLLGLAGTAVTLTDGLEIPYIKEVQSTNITNGGVQTSTVSSTALSGIKITLKSNMLDGTVITDIGLNINDIVGFSEFEAGGVKYSQPKTVTKAVSNTMRVQPGVPIVISGLFRNKTDKGWNGLPGLSDTGLGALGGARHASSNKTEMVIVVTPRVIKYVMK